MGAAPSVVDVDGAPLRFCGEAGGPGGKLSLGMGGQVQQEGGHISFISVPPLLPARDTVQVSSTAYDAVRSKRLLPAGRWPVR